MPPLQSMQSPTLILDLVDELLCMAVLIQLTGPRPSRYTLTEQESATYQGVYHASACPTLHMLLLQVTPSLSLQQSCLHGNTRALDRWSKLWHTKPSVRGCGGRLPCNADAHLVMDSLSGLGRLDVLEWWLAHETFVKPFLYSQWAIHLAVVKDHSTIVEWWIKHQQKLPLKLSLDLMLRHAIEHGTRNYLDKWLSQYHLPVPQEYAGSLVSQLWREPERCRPVIVWWLEQVAAGIISARYDSNPLADPCLLGHPDLMTAWLGTGLPLPDLFHVWVIDEASKRGFHQTLEWWVSAPHGSELMYTHDALDEVTFPGYRAMFAKMGDTMQLRQVPLKSRLAVLEWWAMQSQQGHDRLELKYSATLVADLLRYGIAACIPATTVMAIANWWLRSGLPMSVVIKPRQLAPEIRWWWDEHVLVRSARQPEPWVEASKAIPETPSGYTPPPPPNGGGTGIMAKIKHVLNRS